MNFKNASQNTGNTKFSALPTGRYNLVVESSEVKTAKSGVKMICPAFIVTDGKYKNRKVWHNFVTSDASLPYLITFLRKAGGMEDLLNKEDVSPEEVSFRIIGARVSAFTEPSQTPSGAPKNELSNWGEYAGPADVNVDIDKVLDEGSDLNEDVF